MPRLYGVALRTKEKMLNAEGGRAFASLDIEAKVTGMDANGSNALIDCGTPGEWYLLPSREVKPLSSASASALDGVDSASDAGGFGRPFDGGFGGSQYGGGGGAAAAGAATRPTAAAAAAAASTRPRCGRRCTRRARTCASSTS